MFHPLSCPSAEAFFAARGNDALRPRLQQGFAAKNSPHHRSIIVAIQRPYRMENWTNTVVSNGFSLTQSHRYISFNQITSLMHLCNCRHGASILPPWPEIFQTEADSPELLTRCLKDFATFRQTTDLVGDQKMPALYYLSWLAIYAPITLNDRCIGRRTSGLCAVLQLCFKFDGIGWTSLEIGQELFLVSAVVAT